jgi:hypothetical protein
MGHKCLPDMLLIKIGSVALGDSKFISEIEALSERWAAPPPRGRPKQETTE